MRIRSSFILIFFLLFFLSSVFLRAEDNRTTSGKDLLLTQEQSTELCNELLRTLWLQDAPIYYSAKTHAWHNCDVRELPSPAQIKDLWPNPVGYGSGIDDCALYGGTLLVAMLDLYKLTGDRRFGPFILDAWQCLKQIGVSHGIRGYVTRGVSPVDGKSTYITSSRDQVTHFVDGLWRFYSSDFSGPGEKKEIQKMFTDLADVMHEQVTEENDFSFLRADGTKDPRGLHRMWHVYSHEAARLPMIYAAAFDVTKDPKYAKYYAEYAAESIRQSRELKTRPLREVNSWVPTYSFYQMQCSLALMYGLERDPVLKKEILTAMKEASEFSTLRIAWAIKRGQKREISELILSWTRTPELDLNEKQRQAITATFTGRLAENPKKGNAATTIHLLGAYANACLNGYVTKPALAPNDLDFLNDIVK